MSPSLTSKTNAMRQPIAAFTSQPQRGLRLALEAWVNHVHPAVPEAEFHVFGCSLDAAAPYAPATLEAANVRFSRALTAPH